jgi:hypothetical protein
MSGLTIPSADCEPLPNGQNVPRCGFCGLPREQQDCIPDENNLNKAFAVSEIDKNDTAVIPPTVNPSHEYDFLSAIAAV